jgi:hypothetical protein
MIHFVYLTTNLVNNKKYIGDHSTDSLNDGYLGSGRPYFKNALKKYGKEKFKREILEFFPTKKEAFNAQEKYIEQYNTLIPNGYNMSPRGGNNCSGGISKEGIEKISISNIGKKFSEEHKKKLSNSHKNIKYFFRKPMSIEAKQKISLANTGKKRTSEQLEQMSQAHLGIKLSKEAKDKLSKSKTGTKASEETRKILSESHKGQIPWNKGKSGLNHTKETKDRIRQTMKQKGLCPQLYK